MEFGVQGGVPTDAWRLGWNREFVCSGPVREHRRRRSTWVCYDQRGLARNGVAWDVRLANALR